jgi:hypothetical protein
MTEVQSPGDSSARVATALFFSKDSVINVQLRLQTLYKKRSTGLKDAGAE